MAMTDIVASDALLACLLPLIIIAAAFKAFPRTTVRDIQELLWPKSAFGNTHPHFSLERAYHAYAQYARLSGNDLSKMRFSYSQLSRANKKLGYAIGYPAKLDRLHDATQRNAVVANGIADLALEEFPPLKDQPELGLTAVDLSRVREALKHFVRDWSSEGLEERSRIFGPILEVLQSVDEEKRAGMKVLVPGCGLGRLAWDISELGYDTTANELSFYMTLALRFLMSPTTTKQRDEHVLRPYCHWFSHQRNNENLFRPITFPDAIPRNRQNFQLLEGDFLQLRPPPPSVESVDGGYDYIVTLFFIDTSLDVFSTVQHIHHLLRPGGKWINLGPLLWTGGCEAKVELSLAEVLQAVEQIGFVLQTDAGQPTSPRTVECEYTADRMAMMRWTYKAEFWVATKSK